ncbi:MAG: LacI family transcriptional regulator [Dorea sp.]|nr:LacI family transcriptional regulator [Dorea sp.]
MTSIREVAKLAGVSPATVSRVLNGTAKVDPDKEKRVREVIEATNFVPNEVARALFKRSSKIIGVIVPNIENPFFSQLAHSLESEAYKYGYRIILCNTDEEHGKAVDSLRMLKRMNADGVIVMNSDEKLTTDLKICQMPVVVMDRQIENMENVFYISSDHYQGGRLATEHLIECGCKRIVIIKGPQEYSSAKSRFKGYLDVCEERELAIRTVEGDYSFQAGLKSAEEILKKYPNVDGIIACNDLVAISVIKVFFSKGIHVPDNVKLVGFDDIEMSRLIPVELTTIHQPSDQMAKKAVELIVAEAEGKETEEKKYIFPVELVKRHSSADYTFEDFVKMSVKLV